MLPDDKPPSESELLYDQFVAGLPTLLREAGLPGSALTPVLYAVVGRFGPISASAGNAMIRNAMSEVMENMFARRGVVREDADDGR